MRGGDHRDVQRRVGLDERVDPAVAPGGLPVGERAVERRQVGRGTPQRGEPGGLHLEGAAYLDRPRPSGRRRAGGPPPGPARRWTPRTCRSPAGTPAPRRAPARGRPRGRCCAPRPSAATSCGSVGMRPPTGHSPPRIRARSCSMVCRTPVAARAARGGNQPTVSLVTSPVPNSSHDCRLEVMTPPPTAAPAPPAARRRRSPARRVDPGAGRRTHPATGGALVLVGMLLVAVNLRAAVTSLGALLDEVRDGLRPLRHRWPVWSPPCRPSRSPASARSPRGWSAGWPPARVLVVAMLALAVGQVLRVVTDSAGSSCSPARWRWPASRSRTSCCRCWSSSTSRTAPAWSPGRTRWR